MIILFDSYQIQQTIILSWIAKPNSCNTEENIRKKLIEIRYCKNNIKWNVLHSISIWP